MLEDPYPFKPTRTRLPTWLSSRAHPLVSAEQLPSHLQKPPRMSFSMADRIGRGRSKRHL
jgi:hypothetical protein